MAKRTKEEKRTLIFAVVIAAMMLMLSLSVILL